MIVVLKIGRVCCEIRHPVDGNNKDRRRQVSCGSLFIGLIVTWRELLYDSNRECIKSHICGVRCQKR
jgi:hypothetical protein